jgi:hypothetical protein
MVALICNLLIEQEIQTRIGFRWGDLDNFSAHHILNHERIIIHSALQVRQRRIVCDDPTARIGLKAADQQKHAGIKTAFDPFFMAFHELAGLGFVGGKFQKDNKHRICSPVDGSVCRTRSTAFAAATSTYPSLEFYDTDR